MREAIDFIWRLSVLAELGVAVRLLATGLAGEYPALLTSCCVLPLKSLLLMFSYSISISTNQRRELTESLAPIEWFLSAWVIFELFSKWTKSYPGIGRFGKVLLGALLGVSLLVSVLCWRVEWEALVLRQNFRIYYILNRIIMATLALFVVGVWVFFRNYPVPIARNVIRHTRIAGFYFLVTALSLLLFTTSGLKFVAIVNLSKVASTAICFCAWALLMTRKGQSVPAITGVTLEDRKRIEEINDELLVFMGNLPKNTR